MSAYRVKKESGSRFAFVLEEATGRCVRRYDIFRKYAGKDGWAVAETHAKLLNDLAAKKPEGEA